MDRILDGLRDFFNDNRMPFLCVYPSRNTSIVCRLLFEKP